MDSTLLFHLSDIHFGLEHNRALDWVAAEIAARWVIGPRSFRRIWPAMGWLGPLATLRPSHGFVAQARGILSAP